LDLRFGVIVAMIFLAALSRLIPHPQNFAPIGGMALFGAAYFTKRHWAFIVPIVSMWISDLVLTNMVYAHSENFLWFYRGSLFTYGALALIALLGIFALKKVRITNLVASALGASVIFFIVSNFGVWFSGTMYPMNLGGLAACYAAGLPFFPNTVLGDLVYTGILFGAFELGVRKVPKLALSPSTL